MDDEFETLAEVASIEPESPLSVYIDVAQVMAQGHDVDTVVNLVRRLRDIVG